MTRLFTISRKRADKILAMKLPGFTRKVPFQTGLLSLIVLIFSFPGFYPEISLGLDGSYVFAFNYFFSHHIQLGASHIFTYGPLVFIYAPNMVGNNLAMAIAATCILYFFFIYSFLLLGYRVNPAYRILHLILIIGLCNVLSYDLIFAGVVILGILNYHSGKNRIWLISISILSAVAFLVKSSYGTLCFTALFSYALYALFTAKRPYILLYFGLSVPFFVLLIWLIMYHSISSVPGYLYTTLLQVGEYSSSLQLEDAVNHWGIFCLGIVFFFLPLFFIKNRLTWVLYIISFIPLYISFKYSFSREDSWHETIILNYIILICAIVILLECNFNRLALIMQISSVGLIYINMMLTGTTVGYNKGITGIGNFVSWVINYNSTVNSYRAMDSASMRNRMLGAEQRKLIGTGTVDCYPFEYTYIPANNLNWAPRPNLQMYISDRWIDSVNASFLCSARAPLFYLWVPEHPPVDNYYCDNRYLLSEDPLSTYMLFDHYRLITYDIQTALFERTSGNLLSSEKITVTANAQLGQWLNIPPGVSNSITRARLHFTANLKGIVRKIFYKDQIYFIDYQLSSGAIKTYRFIPVNASTGLWINPLVIDITKGLKGEKVSSVRIRVSRKGYIKNTFRIEWTSFHPIVSTI